MKKSLVLGLVVTIGTLSFPQAVLSQPEAELQSLRGSLSIDDTSQQATWKSVGPDSEPIMRNYVHQPPLIPHTVEKYHITKRYNKCLSCHSWANYQKANATKVSSTHFMDRDGYILANIAPRHYFCHQCHVPQVDAQPLVENVFEPVQILQPW